MASCTLSPPTRSSIPLLTAPSPCAFSHMPLQKTAGLSHLARATPTIVESRGLLQTPLLCLHAWPCSGGTTWCAGMTIGSSNWVRAAINCVICSFSLAVPSTSSLVTVALVLTQSRVCSLLLSTIRAAIMSWEYGMPRISQLFAHFVLLDLIYMYTSYC